MGKEIETRKQLLIELVKFRKKINKLKLSEADKKSAEKVLGKSISILEGVLSSIVDLVFVFDKQGRFIFYHSPSIESLYLPPEEFIGKKHTEVMPSHLNTLFEEAFKKNKSGQAAQFEYHLEIKGNKRFFLAKLSPIFFNTTFEGSAVAAIDITEKKELENMRLESEKKYRMLVETMNDGLVIQDGTGKVLFVNERICEISGYSKDELIGLQALIFLDERNQSILKKQMKLRRSGSQLPYEIEFTTKDGRNIHALVSPQMILDHEGNYNGSFGVITDISKHKQTEQDLKKIQGHLEEIVEKRTAKLNEINIQLQKEILERKEREKKLVEFEETLKIQKLSLEKKNIALHEVIFQIEQEKKKIYEKIHTNAKLLIFPILEKLKQNKENQEIVTLIQHHLEELTSQFGQKISNPNFNLTPRELEVCNMVKTGLSSKEISRLLNISTRTIEKHRRNIRRKAGISNKKCNLTTFLREL
jgi:PAS domain S-box-containing protein